jgi:Family of unknown function (DUF6058)
MRYGAEMISTELTDADLAYIAANYVTLEDLCADRAEDSEEVRALIDERRLPQPSYVLADGTGMFPADYFRLVDEAGGIEALEGHFAARHRSATFAREAAARELERDWEWYLDGTWGICLRDVTPETIVRKNTLVWSLSELLMCPRPGSAEWRRALREQVEELDALEREFAPDWDRGEAQERPPTRDLLIGGARERYSELFAG